MASFTDPFDDLLAWDFGSGPTTNLTLASTSPTPYLGPSRATLTLDTTAWAAARFDVDDGGVNTTTYWISFAFYVTSWADIFNSAQGFCSLPGFINFNDDPMKGITNTDDVTLFMPFLVADSTSAGKIFPWSGDGGGDAVSEGAWHTARYALKMNGATSAEQLWLDGVQVYTQDPLVLAGTAPFISGLSGVVNAGFGDETLGPLLTPIDTLMYAAGADPGEPQEEGSASAISDPTDIVEAADPPSGIAPGDGSGCDIQVWLDSTDVSNFAISGSVTRRLNRQAQAQITIPMDSAIGGPGSLLKIYFDGTLFFHGMVMDCETDSGEDMGYTVYNAEDPMELWRHRPARDGPDSTDPGDFSNPTMFQEFPTGPQLIEQMLLQSEDDSDPELGEGPLFLDLAGSTFEGGGVDLSGAPVDWPMTIAEVVNLLVSTGEVDVVVHPQEASGGNIGYLEVVNGDYGTDLSGSVTLSYGMGDYTIRRVRWNEDMTNITNKLWYFGGPRIETAADPGGNQHWCFNVQGDDPCFNGGICPSPDAAAMEAAYTGISACRDASRDAYGVRMDVQIFDGASDNCVGPGGVDPGRDLYRWLWLAESKLRCNPRQLIHITPIRGYPIGNFDIGDLITVEATSSVRGGFSGAQRIYQYTISWDEDGPCEISELQTSPNNEGI